MVVFSASMPLHLWGPSLGLALVTLLSLAPLAATDTSIPSLPDWLNPGSLGPGAQIPDTPTCMRTAISKDCPWSWQNVIQCTVYRCNHHVIGICSSHGNQIGMFSLFIPELYSCVKAFRDLLSNKRMLMPKFYLKIGIASAMDSAPVPVRGLVLHRFTRASTSTGFTRLV
jgi:hypothetical protein